MDQVRRLVQKICREIATPQALAISKLAQEGKWAQIQDLRVGHPFTYVSHEAYRDDLLVVEFVRKLATPDAAAVKTRVEKAKETFFKAEAQCHRTNGYLLHLKNGYLDSNDLAVSEFITRWRQNIEKILGPLPLRLHPRYSPGSTLSDKGKAITIPDKMSSSPTGYPHSKDVLLHSVAGTELDKDYKPFVPVRANRFFTVPKDSRTDRGCCVEASLNISCQLDVGLAIRARYNRFFKVDLARMQEVHQELAQLASAGKIPHVTVDLSNASDTVARELVRAIMPGPWRELLESLRATHTVIKTAAGKPRTIYLEKFSSMGNGFTFELETLIFRTLLMTLGVGEDEAVVYGDDIIAPAWVSGVLLSALKRFGFTPNERKTFCEGPFRESCGGDYFLGHDVRAVYLKEMPDEPQKWVVLHNQLLRWGGQERLKAARWFCIDQIPVKRRCFGPPGEDDLWLHSHDAVPVPLGMRARKKLYADQGFSPSTLGFWGFEPVSRKILVSHRLFKERVVVASALQGLSEHLSLRDAVYAYRPVFVPAYGVNISKSDMVHFLSRFRLLHSKAGGSLVMTGGSLIHQTKT